MKKWIIKPIISLLFIFSGFPMFSQAKFSNISLVTFRNQLSYTIGEDTQAYTAQRDLKPFSINKYETSYGLWYQTRTKAEKIGYYFEHPGQPGSHGKRAVAPNEDNEFMPVTMISWYDVVIWCNALSEIRGRTPCYTYNGEILRDSSDTASIDLCECNWDSDGFRLPSEAEWEYAARRTKNGFQKGNLISGQPEINDESGNDESGLLYAWISENSGASKIIGTAGVPFDAERTAEPGTGNPNAAGIYDMSGNLLEFCWDWYGDYNEKEPYGPSSGYERISRGGSWSLFTMFSFAGDRYSYDPNEYYNYLGFRICCSAGL